MDIAELNRRVTIKSWTTSQDGRGGSTPVVSLNFDVWAKVEDRTGSKLSAHNNEQWMYDYKITFRYDPNRIVTSAFTINYESLQMAIQFISYDNEAHKQFCIARCNVIRP